jgi:hypothetical protein
MKLQRFLISTMVVLVLAGGVYAFSQSQVASGDLKGTVSDAAKGRIPGATVTVTNLDTGVERSLMTDDVGAFRFFLLPPADYELKVQLPSFTSGVSFLGQDGRTNNGTIDGVDNNDAAVAAVRSTLSQEAVQEFQINRSNFSAEFGRASGGLVNIVSRSGASRMSGDVITFFRDNSMDERNPFAFGANGSPIDPPYSRQQAGFVVGGPIKKDRIFFFLSYEGLRQRESRFVTFMETTNFFQPTASQRALIQVLSASPSPSVRAAEVTLNTFLTTSSQTFPETVRLLQANSGVFPFKNNDNTVSLRLDHLVIAVESDVRPVDVFTWRHDRWRYGRIERTFARRELRDPGLFRRIRRSEGCQGIPVWS